MSGKYVCYGFLYSTNIHDAMGATQGLHSIMVRKIQARVVKLNLAKAHDRVSWIYLRVILIHIGISLQDINWILSCLTSVPYVILINALASNFLYPSRTKAGMPYVTFSIVIVH